MKRLFRKVDDTAPLASSGAAFDTVIEMQGGGASEMDYIEGVGGSYVIKMVSHYPPPTYSYLYLYPPPVSVVARGDRPAPLKLGRGGSLTLTHATPHINHGRLQNKNGHMKRKPTGEWALTFRPKPQERKAGPLGIPLYDWCTETVTKNMHFPFRVLQTN